MARIPLIEIKNSILLHFASEADSKGNKNSLLDTQEELSIFQNKANDAIKIGLCTQQDYDNVMQIDAKKIKTQVTTMEDLRNSRLKNSQNGKDYNETYYNEMKEKFRKEINKYEKEIEKVKKELIKAQKELLKERKETSQVRKQYITTERNQPEITHQPKKSKKIWGVLAGAIGLLTAFIHPALTVMAGATAWAGICTYTSIDTMLKSNKQNMNSRGISIGGMSAGDPAAMNYNHLLGILSSVQNALKEAKKNFDVIVKQNDFLENMENYVKILDQRDSYLNKLDILD